MTQEELEKRVEVLESKLTTVTDALIVVNQALSKVEKYFNSQARKVRVSYAYVISREDFVDWAQVQLLMNDILEEADSDTEGDA